MTNHYDTDAERLLTECTTPGNVGGFISTDFDAPDVETLYAVDPVTRQAVQRTDRAGGPEFDGDGWTHCEQVPANAAWIGNYPAPKARAVLDKYENGTRIKLTGNIGGWT